MKIIRPFEEITNIKKSIIQFGWIAVIFIVWILSSILSTTHLFPTPSQVLVGVSDLWREGLMVHIFSTLSLFGQSIFFSIIISLTICYLSPLPLLSPIANTISKFRYLPLTGIAFYMAILVSDARAIQINVLIVFVSTFLITSILGILKDIPGEEFDHARTLGCTRWEILWEVIIKGRFDYIIEAIRTNLAIAWVSIVTVESILIASGGLGVLIKNSDKLGNQGRVVAVQIIIILIGLCIDFLLTKSRKLLFRYSKF